MKCKNVNFSFRKECNKCGLPKKDEQPEKRNEKHILDQEQDTKETND